MRKPKPTRYANYLHTATRYDFETEEGQVVAAVSAANLDAALKKFIDNHSLPGHVWMFGQGDNKFVCVNRKTQARTVVNVKVIVAVALQKG